MTCLFLWAWPGDIKQGIKTFQESEYFGTVSSVKGAQGQTITKTLVRNHTKMFLSWLLGQEFS